jgi:hypothetical protein
MHRGRVTGYSEVGAAPVSLGESDDIPSVVKVDTSASMLIASQCWRANGMLRSADMKLHRILLKTPTD